MDEPRTLGPRVPTRARRRDRRVRLILVATLAAGLAMPLMLAMDPAPRLVWNASASAPIGLYWVVRDGIVVRGDFVLAQAPERARALAAARGYLPEGLPLVKRIAALAGDVVCADAGIVTINQRVAAKALFADHAGRPLSVWSGCRALCAGEAFLLMEHVAASFDSRYFGPIDRSAVLGRLVPLWTS